jgi:hypothetical protein
MAYGASSGSLAILAVVAAFACGSPDGAGPDGTETGAGAHVVLGTGEAEFEPMDGEPRLRLVAGVQGGFHAWASFLVYGFESDQTDMVLETRVDDDPETSIVMRARLSLRSVTDASGEPAQSFAGFPAQVYDARCAQDRRVRVEVTLGDSDGSGVSDTRHYIADVPEQQRRNDCE